MDAFRISFDTKCISERVFRKGEQGSLVHTRSEGVEGGLSRIEGALNVPRRMSDRHEGGFKL